MLGYFGHHKCASTWTIQILMELSYYTGWTFFQGQMNVEKDYLKMNENSFDLLLSQTSIYDKISALDIEKGVHVIRDPRDLIVSGYFSHLYSHSTQGWPELEKHRERLKSSSKNEGLMLEIDFTSYFLNHMIGWNYNDQRILELKMEELTSNPKFYFVKILNHFGIKIRPGNFGLDKYYVNKIFSKFRLFKRIRTSSISESTVDRVTKKYSFNRLAGGRQKGQENIHSHYRKGTPGDWRNHLEKDHLDYIYEKFGEYMKDREFI